jgi:hypothetical protein
MQQQIVILSMMLAATAASSQCFDGGQIAYHQEADSLKFYFVSEADDLCHPYDSTSVRWDAHCNPFHQNTPPASYYLAPGDTLRLAYEPWLAVRAITSFHWDGYQTNGALSLSSNTVIHDTPDRPWAEVTIGPNPTDGNFTVAFKSNATKKKYWIIGGLGLVATGWQGPGNTQKSFSLLPINPNGVYELITDFYFDGCADIVRIREKFLVIR